MRAAAQHLNKQHPFGHFEDREGSSTSSDAVSAIVNEESPAAGDVKHEADDDHPDASRSDGRRQPALDDDTNKEALRVNAVTSDAHTSKKDQPVENKSKQSQEQAPHQHVFGDARHAHAITSFAPTLSSPQDVVRVSMTMNAAAPAARRRAGIPVEAQQYDRDGKLDVRAPTPDMQERQRQQVPLSTVYVTVTETTGTTAGESSTATMPAGAPTSTSSMLVTPTTSIVTVAVPTSTIGQPPSPQPSPLPTSLIMSSVVVLTSTVFTAAPTGIAIAPTPGQSSSTLPFAGHTGGITHPNADQLKTVWVAAVIFFCLLFTWNMFLFREILYPWKMWVNVIHESCHVFAAILSGAKVYSVTIDPDKGPISGMTGGQPLLILSAGYLGSILVGSGLIMASFDTSASKIAALIIYPLLILCFYFGRTWARIRVLICIGLSIGMWFIEHGSCLRWYILFLGIMNAFYVLWDCIDDFLFRKANESDAALFARISPPTVHAWMLIWFTVTLTFVTLAILGGLHFFDKSAEAQQLDQVHFLPT